MLRVKQLVIRRKDTWEDPARPLTGSIWIEEETGEEIKIVVDESTSIQILSLCAKDIVSAARKFSSMIEDNLQKQLGK